MPSVRLDSLVTVRGRFHRSVNLSRDWESARDLSEYIVTPAVESIAEQILEELAQKDGARAWSLTGPYGTGKSAFALFLADILASKRPSHEAGKELRRRCFSRKRAFLPVLIQGERAPLDQLITRGLRSAAPGLGRSFSAKLRRQEKKDAISGSDLAGLLVEAGEHAWESGAGGLVVVIDEFGKFLEHASANPDSEDVYPLQQIAESVSRSKVPILFLTVLHSGFADYISGSDEQRRAEWQKVQGRFRDIPFQLPVEQLLGIVAHALETKLTNGVGRAYGRAFEEIARVPEVSTSLKARDRGELVQNCLPIHPLCALLLWPLFRSKAAQNERSLFAFLTSHEPAGFQDFLMRSEASAKKAPMFGVPELFDYVVASLGMAAFSGTDSRKWALLQHALERIPASLPPIANEIVKSIGLISQYGSAAGIRPSEATLRAACTADSDFNEALSSLREASIVVHRRHEDSFGLWEGSDLDLDEVFAEARARVGQEDLASRISRVLPLRPIVARAHSINTGTLRYFDVSVADPGALSKVKATFDSDGLLIFAVGDPSLLSGEELSKGLKPEVILAVPTAGRELEDALDEYERWKWVQENVTELAGDPVARQEVQARVEGARDALRTIGGPTFGSEGHSLDPSRSTWFVEGKAHSPRNSRELQQLLSSRCEELFAQAPRLHNELLNRQNLSSAAARARRNLLEHMIERSSEERLGIQGFPPEFSMYQALLTSSGMHRKIKGSWRLGEPKQPDWKPAWDAVVSFLADARSERRRITDLFAQLKQPHFGLRDGPIPVLLTAALVSKGHEVALYEDGLFVPELTTEAMERMIRRPETFEVQSYRLTPAEKKVLAALSDAVQDGSGKAPELLDVVKVLIRVVAELPPYSRQTRRLPPRTQAIREALAQATDPKALLFRELPEAAGVDLSEKGSAAPFAGRLRDGTLDLSRAYSAMLGYLEDAIRDAFSLPGRGKKARSALADRATPLVKLAGEPRLQVFVREASRVDDRDWREVLGRAVLDGKPPSHWRDHDLSDFSVRIQSIAIDFDRLEDLASHQGDTTQTVITVGVLEGEASATQSVVSLPGTSSEEIRVLAEAVKRLLGKSKIKSARSHLAAVGLVARDLVVTQDDGEA